MKLSDLGQFTIASREHSERGWVLRGSFNHLDTVREGRSWLYVSRHNSLIGDLERLDSGTGQAAFITPDEPSEAATTLPWVDALWQAYHVALILDTAHTWKSVVFEATDALASRIPGWRQLRPASGATPEGGEERVTGGWDHEHCMLCDAHIEAGDSAYLDDEQNWLCTTCYDRFASRHDLSFVRRDA